jgi:hypothetical protein
MKNTISLVLLLSCLQSPAQNLNDSVTVDWSMAGYEGTIPSYSNSVDITAFGAVPGDTLDDQPAIAAAIASLGGNAGAVYFPAGNYLMHSTVNLPDSVVLRGAGADSLPAPSDAGGTLRW